MRANCPDCLVVRRDYLAVLRMLVRRASLLDRWRARRRPGHWLNKARRELLIERGPAGMAAYAGGGYVRTLESTEPCIGCQQAIERVRTGHDYTDCHVCGCAWMSRAEADRTVRAIH